MFKEKESMIEKECEIVNSTFGIYTKIGHHSTLENVVMQDYSYCEPFCIIQNAIISKYCDIARNVRIGATQHPLNRATTHHMTYRRRMYDMEDEDDEVFLTARKEKMTIIGPDVWIGHGAVIQAGVKIGTGAVVGSLSVVTKDVPPYAIVVGVPAKIIRYRLEPEIQEKMMKIAWWNWPDSIIRKRFKDFCIDAKEFVEKYGE